MSLSGFGDILNSFKNKWLLNSDLEAFVNHAPKCEELAKNINESLKTEESQSLEKQLLIYEIVCLNS